jgi:bifunctional DNA-binding transcriptional regulator/antitoxin component of YhaV-PrlF toxin-antitoxin module
MGYDNTITVLNNGKETDITPKELEAVAKFKEEGMPGLFTVAQNEVTMVKALDLYLSGQTYHQISKVTNTKKDIILYLAHRHDWYGTKMEQLAILDAGIKERILQAKLMNQDFVLQIQQFFLKKIGRKMTRFMASGDDEMANAVNKADLEMYMKSVDLLDKISSEKIPTGHRPTVGLNIGDGVTVRKVGENEVTISPRNKTVGEMLSDLANIKRQEEAKVGNDINSEVTANKTEKEEK